MRLVLGLFAFSAAWSLAVACGSSPSSNTPPPKPIGPWADIDAGDIDAMTALYLTDLTLSQRKTLCDWAVGTEGGYGKITNCDGGPAIVNFKDQAACLDHFLGNCDTVYVIDYEACIKVIAADLCADSLYTDPACFGVEKCAASGATCDPTDGGSCGTGNTYFTGCAAGKMPGGALVGDPGDGGSPCFSTGMAGDFCCANPNLDAGDGGG